MSDTSTPSHPEREIVLERLFDAPRELVFDAFTDAEHLPRWWGPRGFSVTTRSSDIRVGGAWRFVAKRMDFDWSDA